MNDFFIDFTNVLREHIEPKSEVVTKQIKKIIKSMCRSYGYIWQESPVEMEAIKNNLLLTIRISVICDLIKNKITSIKKRLQRKEHILLDEEKERFNQYLAIGYEVLDLLHILSADNEPFGFLVTPKN